MSYVIAIVLSVVYAFLEFSIEVTRGNIGHVRNGREPNAGAAIFPVIPIVPALAVTFTWYMDRYYVNLGLWILMLSLALYVPYWWRLQHRLNIELQALISSSESDTTSPIDDAG